MEQSCHLQKPWGFLYVSKLAPKRGWRKEVGREVLERGGLHNSSDNKTRKEDEKSLKSLATIWERPDSPSCNLCCQRECFLWCVFNFSNCSGKSSRLSLEEEAHFSLRRGPGKLWALQGGTQTQLDLAPGVCGIALPVRQSTAL